jgi:hypothetical protein
MKAAFTTVVATGIWYGWVRTRKLPNAEKSSLAFGAMMFVVLVPVYAVFEWLAN